MACILLNLAETDMRRAGWFFSGSQVLETIDFLFFETESYYCRVDWPRTCYVDQAGLEITEIHLPLLPKGLA